MAAADLDGDGRIEVVATTTNTSSTGSQVFVFTASGANAPGWPRYSAADAAFNGVGNHGYGAYGENVGIGQLDDDPQREVVVTYDNHQINLFNHDGTSVLASPWYTNRQSGHVGKPPRLGPVHPLAQAQGRGRPLPPARRRLARREQDAVAAVDGLAAVDRRPRPRRPQRGHRRPQRRAEGAVRDAGLRVHGARRRVRQRVALGSPAQGLQPAPAHEQAGGAPRRRLLPAERHPRADHRQPHRQPPPRDRRPDPRRLHLRDQPEGQAPVAPRLRPRSREDLRVRGRRRRPEPRRPDRARLRHLRPGAATQAASSCSPPRARSSTTSASATRARTATASASPRHRRSPTSTATASSRSWSRRSTTASTSTASRARTRSRLPWPTGRGNLLRNGAA